MNKSKAILITNVIESRIHGIKLQNMNDIPQFDNGLVAIYKCRNSAFADENHINQMFNTAIDFIKSRELAQIGKVKTQKIDNTNKTIAKVIIYD